MPGPVTDCYACRLVATPPEQLAPREQVLLTPGWNVAHAFNSSLPGWLVLDARRHVLSIADLTADEAAELGPLLRRLSLALRDVTGCVKTYVAQFSEHEGFPHLHVHLVPRGPDHPAQRRGPRMFAYLDDEEAPTVSEQERDRIALAVRAHLVAQPEAAQDVRSGGAA